MPKGEKLLEEEKDELPTLGYDFVFETTFLVVEFEILGFWAVV
jgi:hypothetical protein